MSYFKKTSSKLVLSLFVLGMGVVAPSQAHVGLLEEVTVVGQKSKPLGSRMHTEEGVITQDELALIAMEDSGDLLGWVPGMVALEHSGSGKGSQYFLRGFNLDHGTDFSTRVDFVPVNLPSHAHGQGYTDLNFLIPELIEALHYRKGPYYGDAGDFASTGEALIHTARFLPSQILSVSGGSWGYQRLMSANQWEAGMGQWLLGTEVQAYDGPWVNVDEGVRKTNLWLKYASGGVQEGLDISLMGYRNRWHAADPIPERAVQEGALSRYETLDSSSGGETERYSLSVQKRWHNRYSAWWLNAYALRYRLDLWSNFTYFTQPQGDQFWQQEARTVVGGDLVNTREIKGIGGKASSTLGLQWRLDEVDPVGLYSSELRQKDEILRQDQVSLGQLAAYWQGTYEWKTGLSSVASIRWNHHSFDLKPIAALQPDTLTQNEGRLSDHIFTGGVRTLWQWTPNWRLHGYVGRGYHSNDARGVLATVSPRDGAAQTPATPVVPVDGVEVGGYWHAPSEAWSVSLALWQMTLASQTEFLGDEGTTEDTGFASVRYGMEGQLHYQADTWFASLVGASTRAYWDTEGKATALTGVLEHQLQLLVSKWWGSTWQATINGQLIGAYRLEDQSRTDSTHVWGVSARAYLKKGVSLLFDIDNLFDHRGNNMTYVYASQQATESSPVEDRHFHPLTPRSLRITWRYEYD